MLGNIWKILLGLGLMLILGIGLFVVVQKSGAIFTTAVDRVAAAPEEFDGKTIKVEGYIVESRVASSNYALYTLGVLNDVNDLSDLVRTGIVLDADANLLLNLVSYTYDTETQEFQQVSNPLVLVTVSGEYKAETGLQIDNISSDISPVAPQEIVEERAEVVITEHEPIESAPAPSESSNEGSDGPTLVLEESSDNEGALAEVIPGWLLFEDEANNFQIQHPAGWQVFSLTVSDPQFPGKSFLIRSGENLLELMEVSFTTNNPRVPAHQETPSPAEIQAHTMSLEQVGFPEGVCNDGVCGIPLVLLWGERAPNEFISFTLGGSGEISEQYEQMIGSFRFTN